MEVPAPVPEQVTEQTLQSDELIALAAFEPCVVLVDLMHRVIRWCSPEFEAQFSLSAGDSLVALKEQLPGAQDALDELLVSGQAATKVSRKPPSTPTPKPLARAGALAAKLVRPGLAVLKVQAVDDRPDEAMRRHLQDREQLLFTSRRLSVSEMASTLAHELNQPIGTVTNVLHGIKSRLEAAQSGGGEAALSMATPQALAVGVQLALDQAIFAARIISRIRSFTHSRQPQGVRLSLLKVLQDAVGLLDWEMERDGVKVQWDLMPGACEVLADEVMLQQVMVNLLRNALEAMQDVSACARTLTIRLRPHDEGKRVLVSIRDNGCGLPHDGAESLFVPFQSTKPNGMGIGLNICRSFIELHQGRLWCTSNRNDPAPGPGVTFHWTLPHSPSVNTRPIAS
jgi:signal transduction histidine kinase